MSSSDLAISIRGLSKSYTIAHGALKRPTFREIVVDRLRHPFRRIQKETFWALRDVSFDVKKGEVVGIIGRNGAGKSTLLKILSRITEPSEGEIKLYGRVGSLLEVGTGFHPELTGRENIFLNGAILGMTRAEIRKQFDAIVDFAEVEKFLDTPVKRYSSGMYVRLAFAVAAHLNPEILIVDEVLAVGDAEFQKKCIGKMREVAHGESGRAILFVSHNLSAVRNLCTRAMLLKQGRIDGRGSVDEVLKAYLNADDEGEGLSLQRFERDLRLPSQFTEAAILNGQGQPSSDLTCDDAWGLRLTYDVRTPSPSGLYLAFFIQNAEGTIVLFSDVRDATREFPHRLPPGRHTLHVRIPSRMIAPGQYSLTVGSADLNSEQIDHRSECCQFTLHEMNSRRPSRPGVVGVLLPWDHRMETRAAATARASV